MSLEIKPLKSIVLPVELRSDTLTGTVSFDVEYRLSILSLLKVQKTYAEKSKTATPRRKRSIYVKDKIFGRKVRYSKHQ